MRKAIYFAKETISFALFAIAYVVTTWVTIVTLFYIMHILGVIK